MKKIIIFLQSQISYYFYSFLNLLTRKDEYQIFIFDKYFKKDNVWQIAQYIANDPQFKKYIIYYYTEDNQNDFLNVRFLNPNDNFLKKLLSSKYILYSYRSDDVIFFKSFYKQKIIDTMHGSPLKNIGYKASSSKFNKLWKHEKTFDYMLNLADFFDPILKSSFGASENQIKTIGYPRNDIIFKKQQNLCKLNIQTEEFKNALLWMPTWRRNEKDNNSDSKLDFPLLNEENIDNFNDFLKERETLLIIKPHPFQAKLNIFNKKNSNIIIIDNDLLNKNNIDLYSLFNSIDALLTDYSSVYFDFLLTLKPIGFTIDDFDSYRGQRGFVIENPTELMPGMKIKNIEDLKRFVMDINEGKDDYYKERIKINNLVNKYQDGNSTKRLIEILNLKTDSLSKN